MGLKEAEYYEIELPKNGMDGRQNNGHMDKVGMYEQYFNWMLQNGKPFQYFAVSMGQT